MSLTLRLLAIACFVTAVAACNKQDATAPVDGGTPAETAAPVAPAPAPAPTTPAVTDTAPVAGAAGEPIGVAECDAFLTKYEACVNDKMPAESRAAFATGITQWRDSWRGLAKDPANAATLASVCTQQHEQAKTSMSAYGCAW